MERTAQGNRAKLIPGRSLAGVIRAASVAAADLLIPVCCAACGRLLPAGEDGIVCGHCWSRARELPHPRCDRCGHPVGRYSCRWCSVLPRFVRAARSYCWIGTGTGRSIIHALKYDGWTDVASGMAERMARTTWPPDVARERSAVVPVPLSSSRHRERGFNQSTLLAAHLARAWGIPLWDDTLRRSTASRSQTQLTPGERLSNVAGAFDVNASALAELRQAHVILVDDVVTTGATLRACAATLFASGTRTISYITFGRAPASGDRLSAQG